MPMSRMTQTRDGSMICMMNAIAAMMGKIFVFSRRDDFIILGFDYIPESASPERLGVVLPVFPIVFDYGNDYTCNRQCIERSKAMSVFTKNELEYMGEQRLGRLATVALDGNPRVVPVGFR